LVVVPPVSQQIQPITVIGHPKHHKVTAPDISMNIYNYHPRSNFEKKADSLLYPRSLLYQQFNRYHLCVSCSSLF